MPFTPANVCLRMETWTLYKFVSFCLPQLHVYRELHVIFLRIVLQCCSLCYSESNMFRTAFKLLSNLIKIIKGKIIMYMYLNLISHGVFSVVSLKTYLWLRFQLSPKIDHPASRGTFYLWRCINFCQCLINSCSVLQKKNVYHYITCIFFFMLLKQKII